MLPPISHTADRSPLRVLIGHRPPAPKVRYVDQIIGNYASDVEMSFFGGQYRDQDVDVVHIPDFDSLTGADEPVATRLATANNLVHALEKRGIPLVQTVLPGHITDDPARRILHRATAAYIVLDEVTSTPDPGKTTLIPHSHYRSRFLGYPRGDHQREGRLLCISRSQFDRSGESPLKVFSVTNTPEISLRIVGDSNPLIEPLVIRALRRSPDTVSARLELLSDAEIIREIDAAELVILPGAESLEDLTMLFLVLSLDRPVIIPESDSASRLAAEVGPGWIIRHTGALTAERLDELVAEVRGASRSARPNLDARDPEIISRKYVEVYRSVAFG